MEQDANRNIVIALDGTDTGFRALDLVFQDFYKARDVVHVVHVVKCMSPQFEIHHGNPRD